MGRPVKHYGKWRIRWNDAHGERQSEVYDNRRDAELSLRRHSVEATEIRRGLRPEPRTMHTFSELADEWLAHRAPKKRSEADDRSIIKRHLRPAFGALRVADVTTERVDPFVEAFARSEKTLANVLTLLIAMLNFAVARGWIVACPKIRKPRVRIAPRDYGYLRTDEEIRRVLDAARKAGDDVHALYTCAIYTGMRAGELAGLRWSDVDLERRLIVVQRSFDGPTKADEVRYAPIVDTLLPVLREWRRRAPGVLAFPNAAGKMHGESARIFQETFKAVLRDGRFAECRIGRRDGGLTFHSLRHTFASHWMMRGGDIFKLQRIAGWKSFAMVQRYAHLAPDMFTSDYARFGAAASIAEAAE